MKKIAIISPNFPAPGRPMYVFVQQLVFALVDLGVRITVIAPQSITHAFIRKEKILPFHSVEFTSKGFQFEIYRPYDFSFGGRFDVLRKITQKFSIFQICHILDKIKPEVLYGHFWYSAAKVSNYALKKNIPLFVACGEGDDAIETLLSSIKPDEKQKLVESIKGVISVSSENKRICEQNGLATPEKITVIPNCVDTDLFRPKDRNKARDRFGLADNDFCVLFVGGFIKRKGPDKVACAINNLSDKEIKAIFIGKPMGADSVVPDCQGIKFIGTVDHSDLPDYYNAADVFVLPTLKEGCCNAIVEALACGLPVISSNRPFNEDILNSNNSILVNPDNVIEIEDAIRYLKTNNNKRLQLQNYIKQNFLDYSITKRATLILSFIEKMK